MQYGFSKNVNISFEKENGSVVSIFNPVTITEIIDNKNIGLIANEVKQKLERVLEAV